MHVRHRRHRHRRPACWPRSPSSSPSLRRRDTERAVGLPVPRDREPRQVAPPAPTRRAVEPAPTSGREIELAAAVERRDAASELVAAGPTAPVAVRPARPRGRSASPAGSSSTAASSPASSSASAASAPPCSPSCGRRSSGGFGSKINVGKVADIKSQITAGQRLLLLPRGPHVDHRVPGLGARQGQAGLLAVRAGRHGGRARRALPEVRAPRLPRAAVRHLAVVRVPVPRLAVQPGR